MMNLSTDGFVVVDAAGKLVSEPIASNTNSAYCGDAAEMAFPLAAITIGRRTWWIERSDLEDGYDYLLLDPRTGDSVHINGL